MSLKSIETQVALPRSIDAAKLHDQHLQKEQHFNDNAIMNMQNEEVKQRSSVVKQEKKGNASFHHQDENRHEQPQHGNKHNNIQHKKKRPYEKHPYKGNFLDFSG